MKSAIFRIISMMLVIAMSALLGRQARAQASVRFDREDKPSIVVVEGRQCTTPCSLFLTAGTHTVTVDGAHTDIKVSESKGYAHAHFRSDIDMVDVVGGGTLAGVGVIAGVITLLVAAGAFSGTDDSGNTTGLAPVCCGAEAILLIPSILAILAGGVWLGLGLLHSGPRVVVGTQRGPTILPNGLGVRF